MAIATKSEPVMMPTFYAALSRCESPARALRQALLRLRDHYPSPFNWAAFVPVGDVE